MEEQRDRQAFHIERSCAHVRCQCYALLALRQCSGPDHMCCCGAAWAAFAVGRSRFDGIICGPRFFLKRLGVLANHLREKVRHPCDRALNTSRPPSHQQPPRCGTGDRTPVSSSLELLPLRYCTVRRPPLPRLQTPTTYATRPSRGLFGFTPRPELLIFLNINFTKHPNMII